MISNFQPSPPVDASATTRGLVNLVAQVIAGIKTFTSAIVASAGIQIGAAITGGSGSLLMNNTVGTQCTWNANGLFINAGVAEIAALNIPAQLRGNNAVVRVLSNLGALSTDVVTVAGTTLADASVNAAAKLWSLRTGIGGTEVEQCYFTKTQLFFGGAGVFSLVKDSAGGLAVATSGTPIAVWLPSGISRSGYGFDINPGFGASLSFQALSSGQVNQSGTDSSATPGAATINKPSGISAIASGATSCTITNSLIPAVATKRVKIHVTFNQDHGAARHWVVQTTGGGSFVVTLPTAATANAVFSWEVSENL